MMLRRCFAQGILLVCVFIFQFGIASAATYYISPSGSDANPGTSTAPWKTFAFVIPKLNPGDTLYIKDGTYGPVIIDCAAGAKNGTNNQPISLKAENERQARLLGPGYNFALLLSNCAYWVFEGLQMQQTDLDNEWHSNVSVSNSNHATFRRNLIHHSNQGRNGASLTGYNNVGLMMVENSDYLVVEENEFWDSGRNMLQFSNRQSGYGNHIARRNYFNYGKAPFKAAGGTTLYPSSGVIVENSFFDGLAPDLQAAYSYSSTVENNKFFGNISIGYTVAFEQCRDQRSKNSWWENNISVQSTGDNIGFSIRGSENVTMRNNTSVGGYGNYNFDAPAAACVASYGSPSLTAINNLGLNGVNYGWSSIDAGAPNWTNNHHNSYGSITNYNQNTNDSRFISPLTIAPGSAQLNCPAFILPNSPYKGIGAGGGNIGATVLYAMENGLLTNKRIWNATTREIDSQFIGVVVAGVNDGSQSSGKTLSNFGSRLHPNCSLADFTAVYGSSPTPSPTPNPTTSPDRTCTPPSNSITDSTGSIWTLGTGSPYPAILKNGVQASGAYGQKIMLYQNTIYIIGDDPITTWYRWTGTSWTQYGTTAPSTCLSATPTPTPTPAPQGCTNPTPIPSGFASPCPVFNISPASGSVSQNFTVSLAPDLSKTVWIYKTLYITEGSTWKSITLPGTVQYTYWLQSNVTFNFQPSTFNLTSGVHYLASWDWTWDANAQCYMGPGASACGGGSYRLQQISMQ